MAISQYKRDECERVAKRFKKSEFAGYLIHLAEEHERELERAREEGARETRKQRENDKRKIREEREQLDGVRAAIRHVLKARGHDVGDEQLTLMLDRGTRRDETLPRKLREPADVLQEILDKCESITEELGGAHGAPSYDDLLDALNMASGDREELLKLVGMTDFEWVMCGGASYADIEP